MNKNTKFIGVIVHGHHVGTKLGFPTANVKLSDPIDIEFGVYVGWINIDGNRYKSVIHYGPRSILNDLTPQLEVHILDFTDNLYDKYVEVELKEKIRNTITFDNSENLIDQIKADIAKARLIFDSTKD